MMGKYLVMAKRFSEEKNEVVYYIAGEFEEVMNARIFRDAYNKTYGTNNDDTVIVNTSDIESLKSFTHKF